MTDNRIDTNSNTNSDSDAHLGRDADADAGPVADPITRSSTPMAEAARPLGDAADRERITGDTGSSLFVEAGAGTGKTRSLVERIVHLVEHDGVDVARVAAITFTEAAARELRVRVRDALLARAEATGNRRLALAGAQIESAAFTTLHGFALRILSDHPIEAGLPPGFGVVDEMTSIVDFDDAWNLFMGRIGDEMALYELQERAAALDVRLAPFAAIAQQFDDNWDRLDPALARSIDQVPELAPIEVDDVLNHLGELAALADTSITRDDPLYHGLVALGEQVAALAVAQPIDRLQGLALLDMPPGNRGRVADWEADPGVGTIKKSVSGAKALVAETIGHYRGDVTTALTTLVTGFVLDRVERRRSRGELSFHDLLVLCRRLLRTNETVRFRLHQRYSRLLLDEFQDTDPIQIELAVLLAVTDPVGDRDWTELAAEIEPGRLVVVGDPKQSIYRFRRADIAVYASTEHHLAAEPVALATNFRSVPGIIDWVNAVFGSVMGDGEPGLQPAYRPLLSHRAPGRSTPVPVRLMGGPVEANANQIRAIEARHLASAVCRVMDEEWPVDTGDGWRAPRLNDIAILIPSRLSLPALESAFSAATIPYRPETNSLVYATQEVRDVLAAVRAVVDPTNPVDVVAALRSSLFAVPDGDLVDWFDAEGTWDYRRDWIEEAARVDSVASAFEVLRRWHRQRWWTDPASMVDQVVTERRLREVALADPRPRDRWRRYRFLAEQAREFTETQGGDLYDFVRWAEIQSSELARITEPIPAEPDDDAVRLLTIHGSKGLEFPIVLLAGAATAERSGAGGPQALFPSDSGPEVKLRKGTETAGFDAQASIEDMMDGHERIRLHYVAATRARDHLVVSAYHKPSKSGTGSSMGRRTFEACADIPDLWLPLTADDEPRFRPTPPTQLRLSEGGYGHQRSVWLGEQAAALDRLRTGRQLSPTALVELERGVRPLTVEGVGEGATTLALAERARATALGLAVHEVLEVVDLTNPGPLDALARAAASAVVSDDEVDELATRVVTRAKAALAGDTLALAAGNRHWKELYLAVPAGDGLLEGVVDLCIETDDGLIVVDYKTDRLDPDAMDEAVAAKVGDYRLQLAAYARALTVLTGQPVIDARLLFLTDDGVHERSVPDLAAAVADVERSLTRELGAGVVGSPGAGPTP